jgi:hypothetical protein
MTPEALARRILGKMANPRSPTVVLLSCTKTKEPRATTARELYEPSASFREGVAYAERRGWPWAVLSAKYGLLLPDDRATNYDETLMGAPTLVRAFWADRVLAALTTHGWADGSVRLEIHAGKDYTTPLADRLRERGVRVDEPLAGLGTGYRRNFYKKDREKGSRGVVRAGRGSRPKDQNRQECFMEEVTTVVRHLKMLERIHRGDPEACWSQIGEIKVKSERDAEARARRDFEAVLGRTFFVKSVTTIDDYHFLPEGCQIRVLPTPAGEIERWMDGESLDPKWTVEVLSPSREALGIDPERDQIWIDGRTYVVSS